MIARWTKKGFSIALPIRLIEEIEKIAATETRSRNGQIEHFLDQSVKQWTAKEASIVSRTPLVLQEVKRGKVKLA